MAIWSRKSKSPKKASIPDDGMIGGLSVDAQKNARRGSETGDARAADMTVGDYVTGIPSIRLTSLLKGVLKQMLWAIPLFIIGVLIINHYTKDIKRSYRGEGSLLVQIGPEYIYTPVGTPTSNSGGISQTPDTIALNEVGIMKNASVIEDVTAIMSYPRGDGEFTEAEIIEAQNLFNKSAYKKIRAGEELCKRTGNCREFDDAKASLYKRVAGAYSVAPRPKSSLIDVAFEHENPDIAIETLNQFILAYKAKRKDLFVAEAEDTISERRDETARQLKANELAIARFLERNDISDFTSEQMGLRERSEELKTELNTLRGLMAETESALASVEDQLRATPETINLYVDDRASQRVAQAELELKQLLAKYLPTSNPVRQKRTELEELKRLQSANNGQATGGRRVGPNTVYQALLTRRNTLKSTADSLREKEFTLQGQLNSAVQKVRRLTKISPEYQNLLRERTTLSAALDTYNARVQEAIVDANQTQANSENIKVISQSTVAIKGRNTAKLFFAGFSAAWGLTLLMLALLIVFLNPKHYKTPENTRPAPRRGRSTDRLPHQGGYIPEPIAPYSPAPSTSTDMRAASAIVPQNIAVNATERQIASEIAPNTAVQTAELYDPSTYQPETSYGNPQDYYSPVDTTPQTGQVAATPMSAEPAAFDGNAVNNGAVDMGNNPYLNALNQANASADPINTYTNDLPILGSFSAAKR